MNIVVDVVCKFDIFNAEYVDKWFKFVIVELPVNAFIIYNNVDDVEFKLLIDSIEFVDQIFKLLNMFDDVEFRLLIDNIDDDDKLVKSVLNEEVERFKVDIDVLISFIDKVDDDDKLFKLLLIPLIFKKL